MNFQAAWFLFFTRTPELATLTTVFITWSYRPDNCCETLDHVKNLLTRWSELALIDDNISSSLINSITLSASAFGSFAGTRYPVFPSSTEYFIPPTFAPITGVPQAIASSGVIPKGSYHGVVMKISAAE